MGLQIITNRALGKYNIVKSIGTDSKKTELLPEFNDTYRSERMFFFAWLVIYVNVF